MKNYLFYFIVLLFFSCKEKNNKKVMENNHYPLEIINKGLQKQYDIATLEMYSLNSCCNCNCLAFKSNRYNKDTFNILELDLKYEGIEIKNDTISFFFNFCKKDSIDKEVIYIPIGRSYTECLYNGISFKGNSDKAFPMANGNSEISDVDTNFLNQSRQNFSKCLENRNLSTTLSQYVKSQ